MTKQEENGERKENGIKGEYEFDSQTSKKIEDLYKKPSNT